MYPGCEPGPHVDGGQAYTDPPAASPGPWRRRPQCPSSTAQPTTRWWCAGGCAPGRRCSSTRAPAAWARPPSPSPSVWAAASSPPWVRPCPQSQAPPSQPHHPGSPAAPPSPPGSSEKRAYLQARFPQLDSTSFANSRDTSFEQHVLQHTGGKGEQPSQPPQPPPASCLLPREKQGLARWAAVAEPAVGVTVGPLWSRRC